MANGDMANICPLCMANMDLVGRVHNCVPVPKASMTREEIKRHSDRTLERIARGEVLGTYRYRDPEKRKTYMREYMRKRRGRPS